MKEGQILEYYINNQKKPKIQIANELGMSRKNLYDFFTTAILKRDTKEKFEKYFGAEIFSGENLERAKAAMDNEAIRVPSKKKVELKEDFAQYDNALVSKELWQAKVQECNDLREYNKDLKEHYKDLKLLVETQQRLIERLEHQIKPSNNTGEKENG